MVILKQGNKFVEDVEELDGLEKEQIR
jgi:hypothetical protein